MAAKVRPAREEPQTKMFCFLCLWGFDGSHNGSHHALPKINGSFCNGLMGSSSMPWVIDQWVWVMCCGSSHGWRHLLLGHSLWGVNNGVTHVTMGSPILTRLANVKKPFSLEASVALRGGSTLRPNASFDSLKHAPTCGRSNVQSESDGSLSRHLYIAHEQARTCMNRECKN